MCRQTWHKQSPLIPMQNPSDNAAEIAEVNVIPLADICLVLVIIIMLISPLALQSMIQVQAAQAVAHRPEKSSHQEPPLFVDITVKGFTVNNNTVSSEYELFNSVRRSLAVKEDKTVLISSQPQVKYEQVVRVLDIIKQSGAKSLSLVPRKKEAAS